MRSNFFIFCISFFRAISRRCIVPITIKGIDFKKGTCVAVDTLTLHNDPQYWQNPREFYPLRFHPDNKINPLVYVPFGIGPRICVGMRFAQIEIKMALAKILAKYDVINCEQTPEVLQFSEGVVKRPKDGIPVMFKKREKN